MFFTKRSNECKHLKVLRLTGEVFCWTNVIFGLAIILFTVISLFAGKGAKINHALGPLLLTYVIGGLLTGVVAMVVSMFVIFSPAHSKCVR